MRLPDGVSKHAWAIVRAQIVASASTCALCGKALWATAPPRSRWSTEVDHVLPLAAMRRLTPAEQRRLALTPGNLQAVHSACNSRKRDRPQRVTHPRPQSRLW